ncbi:MAG: fused MFS/spermidine synthase [Acidobacteriota bacterium]
MPASRLTDPAGPETVSTAPLSVIARIATAVLFVFSGIGALVYELVWTRQFSLVFGASATAEASVLAAYMGGLGLGAWLMARWIGRVRHPLLVYAGLEVVIAAFALAVAPLLGVARGLYVALYPALGDAGTALFYWACTTVILAVPTCCMGATLPLLVKHWVRRADQIGRGVAVLYMANTLGAAVGTVVTAFVLIPHLGLGRTLAVAVALNLGVAAAVAVVWATGRLRAAIVDTAPVPSPADGDPGIDRRAVWIFPLIGVSGLVGMAYEVFWSRALTPALGGSLFAFATMLAAFLLGISLGSSLSTVVSWSRRACWIGFGCAQAGVAACSLAALWALDSGWAATWIHAAPLSPRSLALVAAVLVPGALLLGVSFPLAVRAVASTPAAASRAAGRVYAWNTAGTVLGAIACGFWWLPTLRFDGTAALLVALSLGTASTAWLLAGGRGPRVVAAAAAVAVVAALWIQPPTPWSLLGRSVLGQSVDVERVAYFGVGRSSTVLVERTLDEYRLSTNGLPESTIQSHGGRTARYAVARWLALLPAAMRPDASRAMVVGFGAGITAHAFPPRITHIDVAELEPEVLRANRSLSGERLFDPLAASRVRIVENDARNLLATTEATYDVIVSQPSHPWTAGASNLFTREFYRLADSRLTESGVFLQWIGLRFVDRELLASLVTTLQDTFAHVEVYRPPPSGAALLVASQRPFDLHESLARSWPTDQEAWADAGIHTPRDVPIARWLDADGTRALAARGQVSTDYRNLMATRAPRLLGQARDPIPAVLSDPDPVAALQRQAPDLYPLRRLLTSRQMERARRALDAVPPDLRGVADGLWDLARGNRVQGERRLRSQLTAPSAAARHEAAAALLIHHAARPTGLPTALVQSLKQEHPELDAVLVAWQRLRLGDVRGAAAVDERLAAIEPTDPEFVLALRMRLVWRLRSQDAEAAGEALHLVRPAVDLAANPRSLILRAQLAEAAADWTVFQATLAELAGKAQRLGTTPPMVSNRVTRWRDDPRFQSARWQEIWAAFDTPVES